MIGLSYSEFYSYLASSTTFKSGIKTKKSLILFLTDFFGPDQLKPPRLNLFKHEIQLKTLAASGST